MRRLPVGRVQHAIDELVAKGYDEQQVYAGGLRITTTVDKAAQDAAAVAEGVFFTRDLVNEPANVLTTSDFADRLLAMRELGLEVLGRIPIEPGVRSGGDAGVPITSAQHPAADSSAAGAALRDLARTVAGRISVVAAPFADAATA